MDPSVDGKATFFKFRVVKRQIEIEAKDEGYIKRQHDVVQKSCRR